MLKINQVKLPAGHSKKELETKIRKILRLSAKDELTYQITRRSIDARKKPEIYYVYTIEARVQKESAVIKKGNPSQITLAKEIPYAFPEMGEVKLKERPVIVGAGPCGLFAAWQLTLSGYAPIILERGKCVQDRTKDVLDFWKTGCLNPDSNVQFGEGGAGTFSDGKLNTVVKDPSGRNRYVLETFVKFGAPEEILYDAKPHIGTDILATVIRNMRQFLTEHGAEFHFHTCVKDFLIEKGQIRAVLTESETITASVVILAPGHSARDTFSMLLKKGISMESKDFAVGFRLEHPQEMIDRAMYGTQKGIRLPAAPYKVTSNFPNGRGVYSFCMCPGGYVVNASSVPGQTCVNGMSYSGRNGKNANSAIIVSVGRKDFGAEDALSGMRYQEQLEKANYELGKGKIPQQLVGDYCQNVISSGYGDFDSQTKGSTCFANLRGLMSHDMEQSFMMGMEHFSKIVKDFDRKDAIMSGMESRTSSPVRLLRDEHGESNIKGIYPGGEGAGYAGGIMSAAIDGLRLASSIMERFKPAY